MSDDKEQSENCPVCGMKKKPWKTLCKECYRSCPPLAKRDLENEAMRSKTITFLKTWRRFRLKEQL